MSSNFENQAAANVKRAYTPTPWRRKPSLTVFSGLSDLAKVTGVAGPATVANWRTRLTGFPAPKSSGKFDLVEVLEWMRDHGPRRTDVRDVPVLRVWPHFAAAYQDSAEAPPPAARATMVALVLLRHALQRMRVQTDGGLGWQGLVDTVLEPHHADAPLWVPFADYLRLLASDLEAADARLRGLLVEQLTVTGDDALHLMDLVDLLDRIDERGSEEALDHVLMVDPDRSRSTRASGRRLARLAVAMARLQPGHVLLDPAVGEGSVLSRAWSDVGSNVQLFGQEVDPAVWTTVRSRLLLQGVQADLGSRPADSLRDDQHASVRADAVVIDPPLGENAPALDRWIEYGLSHLASAGRAVVVLPMHEFVSVRTVRRRPQERMRKMLVGLLADDLVEGILVVPARLRPDVVGPSMLVSLRPGGGKVVHVVHSEADAGGLWTAGRLSQLAEAIRTDGLEAAGRGIPGLVVHSTPAHRVFPVLEQAASVKPGSERSAIGKLDAAQVFDSVNRHRASRPSVLLSLEALMEQPDEARESSWSYSVASEPPASAPPAVSAVEELSARLRELSQEASQQRRALSQLRDRQAMLRASVRELLMQFELHRSGIDAATFEELRRYITRVEHELG